MISLAKKLKLSKPAQGRKIDMNTLHFIRARNRNKAHSKLLDLLRKSGLTRSELADMLGKNPAQISRMFAGPSNVTLDTLSDVVFATTGGSLVIEVKHDLDGPPRNTMVKDDIITRATGTVRDLTLRQGGDEGRLIYKEPKTGSRIGASFHQTKESA